MTATPGHASTSTTEAQYLNDDVPNSYDSVDDARRTIVGDVQVGTRSENENGATIYATPSIILRASGSVGITFIMWLLGAALAAAGTAVYIELGTGLPRSGGEKNYLEFMYPRPRFLITCVYAVYAFLTGMAAANSVVFSEYLTHALAIPSTWYTTRLISFSILTFIVLIHGTMLKWGVRLQNVLGSFKLVVLLAVAFAGLLSLLGIPGHSFGYNNANYTLSEVKNPAQTLKRAAPIAMCLVTLVYLFVNIAYFAVVSKHDILNSQQIVAALFFRNLFGFATERVLSAFIAFSVLGNLLAGQFSQARVIQELGREGILPCSSFFAGNFPFNAPLGALFSQYLISCLFLFTAPPGDIYQFLISLSSYCSSIVNFSVSVGLILLYTSAYRSWNWRSPFRAPKAVLIAFCLSNLFLIAIPFAPPRRGSQPYIHLPYWAHPVAGFCVPFIGVAYWYYFSVWEPQRKGFRLDRVATIQEDGMPRYIFVRRPTPLSPINQEDHH
ncbi:APC amino acid permease [Amanita rubescens]|nr:APC amino acid permease [Amanita rubescens]